MIINYIEICVGNQMVKAFAEVLYNLFFTIRQKVLFDVTSRPKEKLFVINSFQ